MTQGKERSTSSDAPHADGSSSGKRMNDRVDNSKAYADAARLMTQPIAGAAVLGALGIGMATQAFGMWLTAVSGAMQGVSRGVEKPREPETTKVPAAATTPRPSADAKVVKFVSRAERTTRPAKRKAGVPAATATKPAAREAGRSDDLKAISGVGPKLESVLNGLGIRSYAQIAALTASETASIEEQLGFKGRIGRDDWVGQAKALMAGTRT